jgi:DNA-binding NarL/FixJ family response regulator
MPKLKTYIVEDSQVIRESLIATLEELAPIKVVATGESEAAATQWLSDADHLVDLVIVDIFLKSGSGLGVLRAVQDLPGHRSVVVLSNYATVDIRRKCLELGANRVFDKSKEIDALMDYCHALRNGQADGAIPVAAL